MSDSMRPVAKLTWKHPSCFIEVVSKHRKNHWRRLTTWTKETIVAEIVQLLGGYGGKFQVNFS